MEVTENENKMLAHFKTEHPTEQSADVQVTRLPATEIWLQTFLEAQKRGLHLTKTGQASAKSRNCAVCEVLWKNDLPEKSRNKKDFLVHFLQHLTYSPYKCIKCEQKGNKFLLHAVSSHSYSHILNKHPECIEEPLNRILSRSLAVKKLDAFIVAYFKRMGLSAKFNMQAFIPLSYREKLVERNEEKKKKAAELELRKQLLLSSSPMTNILPKTPLATSATTGIPNGLDSFSSMPNLPNQAASMTTSFPQQNIFATNTLHQQMPGFMNQTQVPFYQPYLCANNVGFVPDNGLMMNNLQFNRIPQPQSTHSARLLVNLTPDIFEENLSAETEKVLPNFNYFCVFCKEPTDFSSMIDALAHYAEHFNYKPVVCLLCSKKFPDVPAITSHHVSVHQTLQPQACMSYFINEDDKIEEWVSQFLNSQKRCSMWDVIEPAYMKSCLVCDKLFLGPKKPKYGRHVISLRHIHTHLKYFPFECIICKSEGRSKQMPVIDAEAAEHLKTHGLKRSETEANEFFSRTRDISCLNQLINEYVVMANYGRTSKKRFPEARDQESSDEEVSQPQKKRLNYSKVLCISIYIVILVSLFLTEHFFLSNLFFCSDRSTWKLVASLHLQRSVASTVIR